MLKENVVVIDDSIVCGTTSRQLIEILRRAGAKSAFRISSPPVKFLLALTPVMDITSAIERGTIGATPHFISMRILELGIDEIFGNIARVVFGNIRLQFPWQD